MIQCPVCKSMCFDDMEVCFGCMHRFDDVSVSIDGCMASGLPEFEVEEPIEELSRDSPVQQAHSTPTSFTVPVDGRGYNVVISIQPVRGAPVSTKVSDEGIKETGEGVDASLSEAVRPLGIQEEVLPAGSIAPGSVNQEDLQLACV